MHVRLGRTGDQSAAVEVYRLARAALGRRASAQRLARVADKVRDEWLYVVDDDEVVAMAVADPARHADGTGREIPGTLHLSMVFVSPERQRQGVGSALLEGLADDAWTRGYRTISTWSATPEFYQACGFEPTGRIRTLPDGRTLVQLSAELEAPTREVAIGSEGIRLGQLLKFAGLVETGAQAKALLAAGDIEVNGEVETRRGRQLSAGDVVQSSTEAVVLRTQPDGPRPD